jgi:hypothetical protein
MQNTMSFTSVAVDDSDEQIIDRLRLLLAP